MRKLLFLLLIHTTVCRTQEKPIILWDLHGVFFHQQNFAMTFFTYPDIPKLITHMSWPFIKDLIHSGITNIEYLSLEKYNNRYLQEFMLRLVNTITPVATMDTLAHELADQGYEQHLASNISATAFKELINPTLYPEYASFFTLFNLPASQTGHLNYNGIAIKKPNPRYFAEYLAKNNINPYERHIIFVDDNRNNIKSARALGFDAIYFKHPYQLRTELIKRGINVAKPPYTFSSQWNAHPLSDVSQFYH